MAKFQYEFSNQDRQLVVSKQSGNFSGTDYIRLTIYPTEAINNIVTLPDTGEQAIFYSSLNTTPFEINTSPFGAGLDELRTETIGGTNGDNDFQIYRNSDTNIYIKPNEIFNEYGLPQGDYRIQIDFLNQLSAPTPFIPEEDPNDPSAGDDNGGDTGNDGLPASTSNNHYQFIIKQISTSRKEVRLKLLNENILNNSEIISNLTNEFNDNQPEFLSGEPNPNYKYQFKHILNIGTGDHNPIMNYKFDEVTDGKDNQSIILKLYDTLPTQISTLSLITIEREVLTTQTEDIYYFSDVPDVFFGDGLQKDAQENWINPDGNDIGFENLNELSSSIDDIILDNIISSSDNYTNLNTNFNEFENHTFFGSAKKKLVNFKNKVETIQKYYSEISSSLVVSNSLNSDSDYIIQTRKNLFNKINKEVKTFTPYERFLYYDGQNDSTASAPGVGKNYADTIPVTQQVNTGESITLNETNGFNVVYKHSNRRLNTDGGGSIGDNIPSTDVDLFTDKYKVQDKPFFNYSGSIYLSFLLKGTDSLTIKGPLNNSNGQQINNNELPQSAFHVSSSTNPSTIGTEYRRFIYRVSQSYWAPTDLVSYDIANIDDWGSTSLEYEILSGSIKTGSFKISDGLGVYPTTVVTSSVGMPFSGSCMPAGELFRINYENTGGEKITFITDVKISLNNPSNALPFDNLYHTSSAEWTNWYNGMYDSASAFDTDNIHSFENNLPLYIQQSSDYNEMKDFLNLQGEQYDLIRNHIDSMGTIHKRGYSKTDSPPDNTLPMLLQNMGWEAINPFKGNLTETLGSYLTGVTSIDDIKNNTWRKTLNNLLYIYKSKGTKNSVRGLLNTYGYPPDILEFQEFGGSTEESNPRIFTNSVPTSGKVDLSLDIESGSFSFTNKKEKLYRYMFNNKPIRTLRTDWWMDSADINTIEFVYKHKKSTNSQKILESSGSGEHGAVGTINILSPTTAHHDGTLLVLSSSDGTGKTYIFDDDNDGANGTVDGSGRVRIQISGAANIDEIATSISTSISSPNGHFGKIDVSDSTQFFTSAGAKFFTSGGLALFANSSGSIVLTQITGGSDGNITITTTNPSASVTGFSNGTNDETLWDLRLVPSASSDNALFQFRLNNSNSGSINITGSAVSMSTNHNIMSDGDLWNVMLQRMTSSITGTGTQEYRLHAAKQSGKSIRTYSYVTMSVSGGAAIDSNYRANQNWISSGSRHYLSSSNLIVGKTHSGSLSQIKGWSTALSTSKFRQHTLNKFSTVGNTINSHRKELIYHFKLNENYTSSSISESNQRLAIIDSAPKTTLTTDYTFLESGSIFNSSSVCGIDFVDVVRLSLQDNNSARGNDKLVIISPRKNIVGNLNPNTSAVKSIYTNNSKPLFRTSNRLELYKSPQNFVDNYILDNLSGFNFETLYANPNNYYSESYAEFDTFREDFFNSYPITIDTNEFIRAHENMFNHSAVEALNSVVPARSTFSDRNSGVGVEIRQTILEKQKYENEIHSIETNPNTITGSINPVVESPILTYEQPKTGSIDINIIETGSLILPYSSSIDFNVTNLITYEQPKTASISLTPTHTASLELPYSSSINVSDSGSNDAITILTSSVENPHSGSISMIGSTLTTGSTVVLPLSGSFNQGTHYNKSFESIHKNWGTGSDDTHFIHYPGGTGSRGDYNTGHIDTRFNFTSIGDSEFYSSSNSTPTDFTNVGNFYNRTQITKDVPSYVQYESFIFGNPGLQKGRMMGKTRYFYTSSFNGEIILPSNHYSKFSYPFKKQMIDGTQNTNPGILPIGTGNDYSTASFYRVKVTGGETQAYVGTNSLPTKDSGDKIIY